MDGYIPLIALGAFAFVVAAWEHVSEQRRIKQLLDENDRMWNEIINKHQKTIAEAYEQGNACHFTIERD